MNYFNQLDNYNSNTAIITENNRYFRYSELLAFADNIGAQINNRCLVFVICRNSFESIAGYIGLMRAGVVLFLIQDSINKEYFSNLIEIYNV